MMTFDEKLAQALENTAKARAEQMLAVEREHSFTLAYRLWEYSTLIGLGNNKKRNLTLCKMRRIVTSVIISTSFLLLGVTSYAGLNIGVFNFSSKPWGYNLFIENDGTFKEKIEEHYGLPEKDGWKLTEREVNPRSIRLHYECGDNRVIFSQEVVAGIGTEVNHSGIKAHSEPLSLYKKDDGLIISDQQTYILIWRYDGYLLSMDCYTMNSSQCKMTKEEVIDLAYSTKFVNF